MKTITPRVIATGIAARRVNRPTVTSAAQTTSANTAMARLAGEPTPSGSEKVDMRCEKFISLGQPWPSKSPRPRPTRKTHSAQPAAPEADLSEVKERKRLMGGVYEKCPTRVGIGHSFRFNER